MTAPRITPEVEAAAARVHDAYLATADRLGWPVKPAMRVPYAELPEDAKELDRATAIAAIEALSEMSDTMRAAALKVFRDDEAEDAPAGAAKPLPIAAMHRASMRAALGRDTGE